MTSPKSIVARFGWLANASAISSLLMCYGKALLLVLMGLLGVQVLDEAPDTGLVDHVQAVTLNDRRGWRWPRSMAESEQAVSNELCL
jgi:hypothetical protein